MDIWEIRLANMRLLAQKAGSGAALARKLEMAYPLLQNYIGKNPTKKLGDVPVHRAEDAFELPRGWMDRLHGTEEKAPAPDSSIWPFAVERRRFDALPPQEQERIGRFVKDTVETWEATQARDARKAG
ncbi:hypothetical protein B0G76_2872 [Paraburkholderia sp. BL23I1N1]|uniref:hypothetical protein n=1 Tax=Paraburkholderia sp. BL23I1N1 TaxID=1938802 RepID=UPI000E70BC23|nr:hypothetical protein [Paraburkholderia sp. BL23I1N1]RKE36670.1 hypothetical protein B0G76_2872 [Paraburkholderia sp. BL23I1N1]